MSIAADITSLNGIYLREVERDSIRSYLEGTIDYMRGCVLDFGCGRQPYKELIESAPSTSSYYPYDRATYPGSAAIRDYGAPYPLTRAVGQKWDTIVCTQVIQYIPDVQALLLDFIIALVPNGHLIMTYPTTWPEVEPSDLQRFTKVGIERKLSNIGFSVVDHRPRAIIPIEGFELPLGYGVIATPS